MDSTISFRTMPLGELRPAPYNPRQRLQPGDPAYRKLKASLREFGLVEPLIWNEVTGHVVGGHARLRILRALGVTEVPVAVVRLSIEREKALNVVLNNHEAQGRFDTEKLTQLLIELEELPEFKLTGFDHHDVANLRMQPDEAINEEDDDLDTPISVTLEMDAGTYERMEVKLEALVVEFDLVSHVRK